MNNLLNDDELKIIINKTSELSHQECILVIQRHIFDETKQEIKINTPDNFIRIELMNQLYSISKEYYLNKFVKW